MASSTTLLNVDPEAAVTLSEFISRLMGDGGANFTDECKVLIDGKKTEELIGKFVGQLDAIYSLEDERDVEGCVQTIVSIMFTLSDDCDNSAVVKSMTKAIVADKENKKKMRLLSLVCIFNLIPSPELKYELITAIFEYAIASGQASLVSKILSHMDTWIKVWSLDNSKKRALYLLASDALTADGKPAEALKYFRVYLKAFTGESLPANAESTLTTAVVKAIVSPVASYNERSALLESIPEGATSATLKPLVTLLRIVCVGSLVEYDAFVKDSGNASMMQEKGIDAETMRRTMGLLAVCTMAANSPTATLTYTEVAAGLGIDASAEGADGVFEAEMWVVEAISEGLLDGSVDQIAGTVTVNNSVHRVFGPDQWKKLGLQVGAISANLQDVLNKVKKQADTKA